MNTEIPLHVSLALASFFLHCLWSKQTNFAVHPSFFYGSSLSLVCETVRPAQGFKVGLDEIQGGWSSPTEEVAANPGNCCCFWCVAESCPAPTFTFIHHTHTQTHIHIYTPPLAGAPINHSVSPATHTFAFSLWTHIHCATKQTNK